MRVQFLSSLVALCGLAACGEKVAIPAHVTVEDLAREQAASDPKRFLTGGERVFFDDFERDELGANWVRERIDKEPEASEWRIEKGWVRTAKTKNQGLYAKVVPTTGMSSVNGARVGFSGPNRSPAPGSPWLNSTTASAPASWAFWALTENEQVPR